MKKRITIGIITRRTGSTFTEPLYFRGLFHEGRKLGVLVYFFSEEDIRIREKRIIGFTPTSGGRWVQALHPWPDIVIDRRRSSWTPAFLQLRRKGLFPYASSKFALKGTATRILANSQEVRRWIPKTAPYSTDELATMMDAFPLVYVKPGNGTGGGSVVRIAGEDGRWTVWGRDRSSKLRIAKLQTRQQVYGWLNRWVESERVRGGSLSFSKA